MEKLTRSIVIVASINFTISVWVIVGNGVLYVLRPEWFFGDQLQLHGPLVRNLGLVFVYLAIAELFLWIVRYRKDGHFEAAIAGCFIILTVVSAQFYSTVNHISLDSTFLSVGVYVGASHLLYFFINAVINSKMPVR